MHKIVFAGMIMFLLGIAVMAIAFIALFFLEQTGYGLALGTFMILLGVIVTVIGLVIERIQDLNRGELK